MINSETKLFISASQRPGNFGATVFNTLFSLKKINAVYLPRKFEVADDLHKAIKTMNVDGCAVSTPLKSAILPFLDTIDPIAKKLNSVNTIKVENGKLTGYNTDWVGAETALREKIETLGWVPKSARILGSGGVVPSVIYALNNLGIHEVSIAARNQHAASELKKHWSVEIENGNEPHVNIKDILVNTIPTTDQENDVLFSRYLESTNLIFDLMVAPHPNSLIKTAIRNKKKFVQGFEMATYQLIEQYFIYFGERLFAEDVFRIVQAQYLRENSG